MGIEGQGEKKTREERGEKVRKMQRGRKSEGL